MKKSPSSFHIKTIDKIVIINKLDNLFLAKKKDEFANGFIDLFSDVFDIPRDNLGSISKNPDQAKKARTLLYNYFDHLDEILKEQYQIECGKLLLNFAYNTSAKGALKSLENYATNEGVSEEDFDFHIPKTGQKLSAEQTDEIRNEQKMIINLFDESTNKIHDSGLDLEFINPYIECYNLTASQIPIARYVLGYTYLSMPSIIKDNYSIKIRDIISHCVIMFFQNYSNRRFIRKCELKSCQKFFIQPHIGRDNRYCPEDTCRVIASKIKNANQ